MIKKRDKIINSDIDKASSNDLNKDRKINNLSFKGHFLELKKRIILSISLLSLFTILGFVFHRWIIALLLNSENSAKWIWDLGFIGIHISALISVYSMLIYFKRAWKPLIDK